MLSSLYCSGSSMLLSLLLLLPASRLFDLTVLDSQWQHHLEQRCGQCLFGILGYASFVVFRLDSVVDSGLLCRLDGGLKTCVSIPAREGHHNKNEHGMISGPFLKTLCLLRQYCSIIFVPHCLFTILSIIFSHRLIDCFIDFLKIVPYW